MKFLPFIILLAFSLNAYFEEKEYHLLYPIAASKQEVLRIHGYRFLSSNLDSTASILVLSNPVENGGFADFALALTNNRNKSIHLSQKDFIIKMRGIGELQLVSLKGYEQAGNYIKPEGFDRLSPKMQAFGCSDTKTKDNIEESSFNTSQAWVWDKHSRYPFKDTALYLNTLDIPAGETKGAIFRIKIPQMDEAFEQSTILVHLKIPQQDGYKFKFILQSLK